MNPVIFVLCGAWIGVYLGDGYFRPDRHDEADVYAYRLYRAKELKRAETIINKISSMDKAFYGR